MTKEQAIEKFTQAALAESHGKDKWGRADNFGDAAHRFRQSFYDDAEFTEVGQNLIEVTWDEKRGAETVKRKQVWYVQ